MVKEESHDIQLALVAEHCYIIVVCLCYVFITGCKPYSYVIGCALLSILCCLRLWYE